MKKMIYLIVLVLALSISYAVVPTLNNYVTDTASVISIEEKAQLEQFLKDLEKQTNGVQFVIYIEDEYPKEYSLEGYTLAIAEQNKIGTEDNDNGILLYVAIKDKEYRWEVGYGIESTLNTPLLGRISRTYLIPEFQRGNYEKGILDTVAITSLVLLNSSDSDVALLVNQERTPNRQFTIFVIVFISIIVLFIMIGIIGAIASKNKLRGKVKRNDRFYSDAATGLFLGSLGGGKGKGGLGGFGGFSGGGGSFGGGGFGGRW